MCDVQEGGNQTFNVHVQAAHGVEKNCSDAEFLSVQNKLQVFYL